MADIKAKKVIFKNRDGEYLLPMTEEKTGLVLFDTILKDHVLTYEETKGLALQGTYVYKEAIAGSRYGYPDFYAKCLEEYNEATNTETVNGVEVKVHSNGHKFYDIANKNAIDSFFNTMGSAWFYGVDIENERIFLPRNNYFEQATGDVLEVGQSVEAGLPNITGSIDPYSDINRNPTGAFSANKTAPTNPVGTNGTGNGSHLMFDASKSNSIYGKSNTVQPNAVKKLLYICVGNTVNYEGMSDVVNQGMEILEQVAQKVNVDGTNLNAEGKSLISGYGMPSNRYIDLTLGASGTDYTAPANGYFTINKTASATNQNLQVINRQNQMAMNVYSTSSSSVMRGFVPVLKGQQCRINYNLGGTTTLFRFVYAEGDA